MCLFLISISYKVINSNRKKVTSVGEDAKKRESLCTVGGIVNWCSHYGTVWRFLKNLNIELPYDPAISLVGIYLKKTRTLTQKDTCTPKFIAAVLQ